MKGEVVVFNHPAGNFAPHNITSISQTGTPAEPSLQAGARFSSGTARAEWLRAGSTWNLDTSGLDPGYYTYYCTLHPWMVGTLAVVTP